MAYREDDIPIIVTWFATNEVLRGFASLGSFNPQVPRQSTMKVHPCHTAPNFPCNVLRTFVCSFYTDSWAVKYCVGPGLLRVVNCEAGCEIMDRRNVEKRGSWGWLVIVCTRHGLILVRSNVCMESTGRQDIQDECRDARSWENCQRRRLCAAQDCMLDQCAQSPRSSDLLQPPHRSGHARFKTVRRRYSV